MLPAGIRIYVACGVTDMRKGFDGLAALVQTALELDPYGGALFLFRGRRGDLLKALVWDGQGLVLHAKRLEKGRFIWPQAKFVMRSPPRLIILNTPPHQIAMSLDPPVLNGMTIADRNIAICYLARVLMEAAGANPEEISDDKC